MPFPRVLIWKWSIEIETVFNKKKEQISWVWYLTASGGDITLTKIWTCPWYDIKQSDGKARRNMDYPFIGIAPRSTMTQNGSTS